MRADRAVEPTRSENITVTWRRSARSSGGALGAAGVVVASVDGVLGRRATAQSSDSIEQLHPVAECCDAKLLQVLFRQAWTLWSGCGAGPSGSTRRRSARMR